MSLTIEDFGGRLASVWSELRPTTRGLVERALQTPSGSPATARKPNTANPPYDARADNELSRLLAALDERALETDASLEAEKEVELRHMADTCAAVLQEKTRSLKSPLSSCVGTTSAVRESILWSVDRFAPSEFAIGALAGCRPGPLLMRRWRSFHLFANCVVG